MMNIDELLQKWLLQSNQCWGTNVKKQIQQEHRYLFTYFGIEQNNKIFNANGVKPEALCKDTCAWSWYDP